MRVEGSCNHRDQQAITKAVKFWSRESGYGLVIGHGEGKYLKILHKCVTSHEIFLFTVIYCFYCIIFVTRCSLYRGRGVVTVRLPPLP
jgi:hypothetical protein